MDFTLREIFQCPSCKSSVAVGIGGSGAACRGCGTDYISAGIVDFVRSGGQAEQQFYDGVYGETPANDSANPVESWESLYYPMNRRVRARVGDVHGKVVALLGNGTSEKEFAFLDQDPALLVVSDLSPVAVRTVRDRRRASNEQNLVFAAIDGRQLPFKDASVDVLYGYAFAHHLSDVRGFLSEAVRVLAPGGRCVFADDAYAPLWQWAKRTALRPLMLYFHRLEGPSPEDLRFTLSGGFREDDLACVIRALGCRPWFERVGLVHYFVTRASERLPPQRAWKALVGSNRVLAALVRLDGRLSRFDVVRSNQIRLVWGLDKPGTALSQNDLAAVRR